ncbi:hypothetical protein [Runella sp.]|uniref:hypothetical protein n=1 Tax=Runella sp. TaxID=1960881 RepID=UPI003D124F1B
MKKVLFSVLALAVIVCSFFAYSFAKPKEDSERYISKEVGSLIGLDISIARADIS